MAFDLTYGDASGTDRPIKISAGKHKEVKIRRPVPINVLFDELPLILKWLGEADRPGYFEWTSWIKLNGTSGLTFKFSDPNLAFEFKLRWS